MTEENKNTGKSKESKVGSYLFNGKWKENEGVKWAFFGEGTPNEANKEKEVKIEKTSDEDDKQENQQPPEEKISITQLGKKYMGNRYAPSSIPPGVIKEGLILSGRYKILDLYKSLEKRDCYLAEDTRLETNCILKELRGDFSSLEEKEYYKKRFKEEAKILADLSHPNLPKVIDYFIESERYFMVIEYIKGFDLEGLMENEEVEITEEQALLWGIDICDVMDYLHRQKPPIIHRDIRPANLFIRENDWAVILFNFSVARRQDISCTRKIGFAGYASPEQMSGKPEPRSDIYSLGATLHHILTGKLSNVPFLFKPVRQLNSSVSEYTEMVIKQALNLKIDERFESAEEMKEALLDAYESLPEKSNEDEEDEGANDPLYELLDNLKKGGYKKVKAIKEMGLLGDPRALKYLVPLLNDDSIVICVNTINALQDLAHKGAIPHLEKLARNKNTEIKNKAMKAIEIIKKTGYS